METIIPKKAEAIVAMMEAVDCFQGEPGPGSWVIDSGKSFIALTWVFEGNYIPMESKCEGLWKLYGGEEILRNARLQPEKIVIKLSGPNKFMSAIIPVRD
jgi:hypothetical protein